MNNKKRCPICGRVLIDGKVCLNNKCPYMPGYIQPGGINLQRLIDENGNMTYRINNIVISEGDDTDFCHDVIYYNLTGAEICREEGEGIFTKGDGNKKVVFKFGRHKCEFQFNEFDFNFIYPLTRVATELQKRFKMVKDWVEECRNSACIETCIFTLNSPEVQYHKRNLND